MLVTGASGYIGGRLVPELLDAGVAVRCLARSPSKLSDRPWSGDVEIVAGDVTDAASLAGALDGMDATYYLVHSMGGTTADFVEYDRTGAAVFRDAAAAAGVGQIVYLGGLGDDADVGSAHLASRHEVGAVLADGPVPVTELRAAMIIGSGSASFEMLRHLVEVLPVMTAPRWVQTRTQPIAVRDVLAYLVAVLGDERAYDRTFEIGGPDIVTYREMMQLYAREAGLGRRFVLEVPVLTPGLSSHWIGLVTPLPAGLARPLVEGLRTEVIVRDHAIEALVPRTRLSLREAVHLALVRTRSLEVSTSWAGAEWVAHDPGEAMPSDPGWSGGTVLDDTRVVTTPASVGQVYRAVTGVGGAHGWYVAEILWELRGFLDRVLGGPGMRRGRRHPDELRVGDAVDFWRVEALVPDRLVRLRAEMKVPGEAWLEWTIEPDGERGGARLTQRARFHPRGVLGRLYWYALLPIHGVIFSRLARRLVAAGEALAPQPSPRPAALVS